MFRNYSPEVRTNGGSSIWAKRISQSTICGTSKEKTALLAVLLLCVCVVVQMLGSPFTLVGQDTTKNDVWRASLSEGFSLVATLDKPALISHFCCFQTFEPSAHPPIIPIAVFHPPLA